MTINSRQKGKRGERMLAAELRRLGFDGAKRGVQYQGGPDSPDVVGISGLHVEAKFTETLNLYAAMKQAESDSLTTQLMRAAGIQVTQPVPVVAHRRNHKPWVLVVKLEDTTEFARRWLAALEGKG